MAAGLLIWLVWTCALSWDIASGTALVGQLSADKSDIAQIESKIVDAENGSAVGQANSNQAGATTLGANANAGQVSAAVDARSAAAIAGAGQVTRGPTFRCSELNGPGEVSNNPTQSRLCDEDAAAKAALADATNNLKTWTSAWTWIPCPLNAINPFPHKTDAVCIQTNNDQWAVSLLSVLAGAVLPICYRLLGAAAAVVRSLSARMREWLLAPRDLLLSLIQLALGAVIGACVGLFVATSGSPTESAASSTAGLLGAVHLSGSALCFIAGFFVEGVFVALEGLMRRVFNIADPTGKPTP
jgi:hypothetical protein